MFSAYCKHCRTAVLLDPARVRSVHNTSVGIVVYFRCHAGHSGVQLVSRTTSRTFDAGGAGATGQFPALSRATPSRSAHRRLRWPRNGRRRPPSAAPRHGPAAATASEPTEHPSHRPS
jgi:hypothetical protein